MIWTPPARIVFVLLALFASTGGGAQGQTADGASALSGAEATGLKDAPATSDGGLRNRRETPLGQIGKDFLSDQKDIWTSPARLRLSDASWLVPLGGITAGLLVTDAQHNRSLSHDPATISRYNHVSDAGLAALLGGAGAMWLLGNRKHNDHWRETGLLAGEAALSSLAVVQTAKYSFGRSRPKEGHGGGGFFQGGSSFPSEHAAAAWAIAGVMAHEYPGWLTKVLVYSAATGVSIARVHSQNHFSSDVLVGALVGNLAAARAYKKRHDVELGGGSWDTLSDVTAEASERRTRSNLASPYVPLGSWVYSAMDRLIALGFVRSAMGATRPWTRFECVRLLAEAGERLEHAKPSSSQAAGTYLALVREFHDDIELPEGDNTRARLESVYARLTGISGQPLSQGYHYDFGQTLVNDYGRPDEQGFDSVHGFSAWASQSRFVVYASGEFQHAPAAPPLSSTARQLVSDVQYVPAPPSGPGNPVNRFLTLDTYVGMTFNNWQLTYGKQSLWWGPGAGGSMLLGTNAPPINMFRVSRVSPFRLPFPLKWMGTATVEFFVGQLSGHNFVSGESTGLLGSWQSYISPQPMISGERFSFKPTANLEFGFSATGLFAGEGVPFTLHSYLKSFLRTGNGVPGSARDPGDGRSGFDLTYRLPFLRNWLTFYADGFVDDQFSPVAYWDRAAWTGGLYLSHFPKVPQLDLRLEGVFTDVPAGGAIGHGFFYSNGRYVMGYTNQGDLIGSWIGRDGQGAQVWSNYWFTAKNRVQFNFRHQKVSQQFLPGGGSLTDFGLRGDLWISGGIGFSPSLQYERWLYPAIQPGVVRNLTASLEMKIQPQKVYRPAIAYLKGVSSAGANEN